MTRPQILIVLGFLIVLAPFSGLPTSWLELMLPVVGIVVIAIAYSFVPKKTPSVSRVSEEVSPA